MLYKVSHHPILRICSLSTNLDGYAFPLLSYFRYSRLIRRFSMCTYLYHILLFFRTHNRILKDTNASTQNNLVLLATNVQISTKNKITYHVPTFVKYLIIFLVYLSVNPMSKPCKNLNCILYCNKDHLKAPISSIIAFPLAGTFGLR